MTGQHHGRFSGNCPFLGHFTKLCLKIQLPEGNISHEIPWKTTIFLWFSHGFPISVVFLWFSYGFPVGFPMVLQPLPTAMDHPISPVAPPGRVAVAQLTRWLWQPLCKKSWEKTLKFIRPRKGKFTGNLWEINFQKFDIKRFNSESLLKMLQRCSILKYIHVCLHLPNSIGGT